MLYFCADQTQPQHIVQVDDVVKSNAFWNSAPLWARPAKTFNSY